MEEKGTATQGRAFLGVHYVGCKTYGRLYKNDEGTMYVGACPRCGRVYRATIGPGGTSERFFKAHCTRNPGASPFE